MKANQCEHCGRFCKYEEMDSYAPFGYTDNEYPDPYEPTYICKKCSAKLKQKFIERFKKGIYYGDYGKSRAEREAAKECNLVWIRRPPVIFQGKEVIYQYVPRKEENNER